MASYLVVSVISDILFVVLDAVINANPFTHRLYQGTPRLPKSRSIS